MAERKVGQRKESYDDEDTVTVLKKSKSLIRTDWGGASDPLQVIIKEMAEEGIKCGLMSAAAIKKIAEKQVNGCRKRTAPRLDEAIKRLENNTRPSIEELP